MVGCITNLDLREYIPYKIQLGGHSKISENFTVSAEVEKLDKEPVVLKMGAEWEAANHFFFGRIQLINNKTLWRLGFSYRTSPLILPSDYTNARGNTFCFNKIQPELKVRFIHIILIMLLVPATLFAQENLRSNDRSARGYSRNRC